MSDKSLIIKKLNQRAKETSNSTMQNELADVSFIESLKRVAQVSNKLGFSLSLQEKKDNVFDEINSKITQAMILNYISIYYVNIDTNEYIGYSGSKSYSMLKIDESGTDFFVDSCLNINKVVHEDDREYMHKVMTKENIINEIQTNKVFKAKYRLLINGKPTYVILRALKLAEDDNNIIIGVRNIDEQTKEQLKFQKEIDQNITYTNIALALAQNFFAIYYVDTNTNEYVEYSLDNENQKLKKVSSGNEFFEESIVNAKKLIVNEDLDKFLNAIDKTNLLNELKTKKTFRLTYRQLIDGKATYVSFSAVKLMQDASHILLGISNIDEQKRKDIELAKVKSIARTDALTGAYNKYSYLELEEKYNSMIKNKEVNEFALVVFDINNLKTINDLCGHVAGDNTIKEAKNIISDIFKNSPVYRIGGDEFVVLLEGKDYTNRHKLIKEFENMNKRNVFADGVVIAVGLSDFDKNKDYIIQDIFNRADNLMYKNKEELKKGD